MLLLTNVLKVVMTLWRIIRRICFTSLFFYENAFNWFIFTAFTIKSINLRFILVSNLTLICFILHSLFITSLTTLILRITVISSCTGNNYLSISIILLSWLWRNFIIFPWTTSLRYSNRGGLRRMRLNTWFSRYIDL